jgi:pentatricopeptide repeat protein
MQACAAVGKTSNGRQQLMRGSAAKAGTAGQAPACRAAGSSSGRGGRAGKAGAWERALALLGELRAAGARPDVVTYSSLIAACQACGGRWQTALALLDEMEAEGARPVPCRPPRPPPGVRRPQAARGLWWTGRGWMRLVETRC